MHLWTPPEYSNILIICILRKKSKGNSKPVVDEDESELPIIHDNVQKCDVYNIEQ